MIQCYGIIPLRKQEDTWEVFLIKRTKNFWEFPKGHSDGCETPKETACRELTEETGLTPLKIFPGEPLIDHYTYNEAEKSYDKEVVYFLAEVEGEIHVQPEEVIEGKWFQLNDVIPQLTYPSAKNLFQQALQRIATF